MKYSAQICTKAIEYAAGSNKVKVVLGQVDSDPTTSIKQVIARLFNATESSAQIEILYDYVNLDGSEGAPNVHVILTWHKGVAGFEVISVIATNP